MQNAQHSSGPMRGRSVRALCRERGRGKVVMQKIADWLGQLGLSEYARRFADNAIDLSVIGDLTEQDLKDIVVLLGHRRNFYAQSRSSRVFECLSANEKPRHHGRGKSCAFYPSID